MKQEQKIEKIRAKCQEILELGKQRTQGKWIYPSPLATHIICEASRNHGNMICDCADSTPDSSQHTPDASFIASCAGTAEAMARSTLVALDALQYIGDRCNGSDYSPMANVDLTRILESWPDELL